MFEVLNSTPYLSGRPSKYRRTLFLPVVLHIPVRALSRSPWLDACVCNTERKCIGMQWHNNIKMTKSQIQHYSFIWILCGTQTQSKKRENDDDDNEFLKENMSCCKNGSCTLWIICIVCLLYIYWLLPPSLLLPCLLPGSHYSSLSDACIYSHGFVVVVVVVARVCWHLMHK